MKVHERLTAEQKNQLIRGVIEVEGKAMNRTALGIVAAVFRLYPTITFKELKELLPDHLNPSAPKNFKSLFKPYTDRPYGVVQPGSIRAECLQQGLDLNATHFTEPNEVFRTADGVEVLVSRSWESKDTETGENDLQNLIQHIAPYGIRVTSFDSNKPFKRGEYHLEVINPNLLAILQKNRKQSLIRWLLFILLLILSSATGYFLAQ